MFREKQKLVNFSANVTHPQSHDSHVEFPTVLAVAREVEGTFSLIDAPRVTKPSDDIPIWIWDSETHETAIWGFVGKKLNKHELRMKYSFL